MYLPDGQVISSAIIGMMILLLGLTGLTLGIVATRILKNGNGEEYKIKKSKRINQVASAFSGTAISMSVIMMIINLIFYLKRD